MFKEVIKVRLIQLLFDTQQKSTFLVLQNGPTIVYTKQKNN